MKAIFPSGRATNPSAKATSIMKYFPTPRSGFQPSRFRRENVEEKTMEEIWKAGRLESGRDLGMWYNTAPAYSKDPNAKLIPKHQLEKVMPNIDLGSKALVTPVSIMSARDGNRVTHDLLHSYDRFIGQSDKTKYAEIDHDNITPLDPKRVGLHPDSISCRARLFRWLRRSPGTEEGSYFQRNVLDPVKQKEGVAAEAGLHRRIIRLANKGKLKAACEEFRRVEFPPPVPVFRALVAACVPGAMLADAISIYEQGVELQNRSRDHEVYLSLMACAIAADNIPRVMWVFNEMLGTCKLHHFNRVVIEPLWQYQIAVKALEYLLDNGVVAEARTIYNFLESEEFLDYDRDIKVGHDVRTMLEEGKKVELADLDFGAIKTENAVSKMIPTVAAAVFAALPPHLQQVHKPATGDFTAEWLQRLYSDLNVRSVMRHARFVDGTSDLMASAQQQYVERVVEWLRSLSKRHQKEAKPLPYLFKSKPSSVNPNVRIAGVPLGTALNADPNVAPQKLSPTEQKCAFFFNRNASMVMETFPAMSGTLQSRMLARQPIQHSVPTAVDWAQVKVAQEAASADAIAASEDDTAPKRIPAALTKKAAGSKKAKVMHSSLFTNRSQAASSTSPSTAGAPSGATPSATPEEDKEMFEQTDKAFWDKKKQ